MPKITPEFEEKLKKLFQAKGEAFQWHEQQYEEEIGWLAEREDARRKGLPLPTKPPRGSKGSAFHTFTRHGYQTGWEAQLIRLASGRTPDQDSDPMGIGSYISHWKGQAPPKYNKDGSVILHPDDTQVQVRHFNRVGMPVDGPPEVVDPSRMGKTRHASANTTGAFLSPEAERDALMQADAKSAGLKKYVQAASKNSRTGELTWVDYDYIEVVVTGQPIYGVSFYFKSTDTHKIDVDELKEALADYNKQTKVVNFNPHDARTEKVRFTSLSDILDYFGIEAQWMKAAKIVYKRVDKTNWKLHTAYAVNDPPVCRPDVKTGKWTGAVRKPLGTTSFVFEFFPV